MTRNCRFAEFYLFNNFKTRVMSENTNLSKTTFGSGKDSVTVDHHLLKKSIYILKALNHKLRIQILQLLEANKQMTVTEIFVKLRIEQSVASQQLAIMRLAGVVSTERQGKFIYYSINKQKIAEVCSIAAQF
jgi:ArsR family transcriptional regulator, virulence genes transcriptional regulator